MTACRWSYCDPDTCICNEELNDEEIQELEDRRVMQADFERGVLARADAEDRDDA